MNENTTKGEKMDKARIAEIRREIYGALECRTCTDDTVLELLDALEAALARAEGRDEMAREISAWRDATKADERTKAIHIGEYHLRLTVVDDDGEESPWNVPVPWTMVKEIMEAIRSDKNKLCDLRASTEPRP